MLIVFLLILTAVKANESVDQDGLRKTRQLDLGLQDIRTANEELLTTTKPSLSLKNSLLNGYLPPVSSSSSSEVVSAQSQQAFDFKSVNSVEKESELCKFPYDNEACNFKESSTLDTKIPKPSRDLVPPFKDAERELTFKATTVLEQANKKETPTTRNQKTYSSTTEKPVTKFFKHEPNRKFTKIKATTLRSRIVGNKAEATNELRSYLPPQPEFSAAAQTNVAVFQSANRNNEHDSDHHHGHHHGDNFNICADAFHSFLCAPLKARKRITGALPVKLLGESSFINYQKTLANFDRETASSNGFRNEYLPPNSFSHNLVQSPLSPFTTNKPSVTTSNSFTSQPYSDLKNIPESSNFKDNFYLPPVAGSKNSPVNFASSNVEFSTTKFVTAPTVTTNPTTPSTKSSTISPITSPTTNPTPSSTTSPTTRPTTSPTTYPTTSPTTYPTTSPVTYPTPSPTTSPTTRPTTSPITYPTPSPTTSPNTTPVTTPVSTSTTTSTYTSAPSTFIDANSVRVSDSFVQNAPTASSALDSTFSNIPVFNAFPSNENRYLPPSLSPQPSASFVSNSKSPFPITSTSLPSSSSFASVSPNTFGVSNSKSFFPVSSTSLPSSSSFASVSPNTFGVSNSKNFFPVSSTSLPSSSSFAPVSSNIFGAFNSKNFFPITSTSLPSSSSFASLPPNAFNSLHSISTISSQKPKVLPTLPAFTSTSSFVTTPKPLNPISSFGFQPINPKNSYIPPIPHIQSSSNTFTTTIKPYSSTSKPTGQLSNLDLTYLPPDSREPAAAIISASAVPAPQNNNPFHHGRDLCTDPFHSFLCTSAKPRKKITGELPLGFKPESSNTDALRVKPEQSVQNENKVRPNQSVSTPAQNIGYQHTKSSNLLPSKTVPSSEASFSDYIYSKPDRTFSSSSQENKLLFTTSTRKPEPVYRPSETKSDKGYEYPKPDKIFPLPGVQENTKVTVTTTSSPTTGYSYTRPQKPFPLPVEQTEIRQKPKQKTTTSSPTNVPFSTNQAKGSQYPKPDQNFNLPDKKGYSYPKPEKKLELPGEDRPKSVLPQSSSNLNGLGNLGSADFIPVNKVEFKRAESSKLLTGLRRFGERMKKRERQAQLLKRQLH